jgi:hypothetical protein
MQVTCFNHFIASITLAKRKTPNQISTLKSVGIIQVTKTMMGDDKIIKFKTSSNMISSKVNETNTERNGFDVNQDRTRLIHNLIKEKLERISNQFVR